MSYYLVDYANLHSYEAVCCVCMILQFIVLQVLDLVVGG